MKGEQNLLRRTKQIIKTRQVRIGTNATVMTVAFLGILVLLNIVVTRNHQRWDLTASGEFSLSEQTEQIIQQIDQPVEIVGFYPQENAIYRERQKETASKLEEYTSRSTFISYRTVDMDVDPLTAKQYEVTSPGTLVFVSGDRQQKVFGNDEATLTGALLKVTQSQPTTIYFLAGHKERSIDGFEQQDYSQARQVLEENNFLVDTINLFITDTIPIDNTVLVVAEPQEPLPPDQEEVIATYVARGGRLLLLSNPLSPLPLTGLLEAAGLVWHDDILLDRQSELGNPFAPVVVDYPFNAVTEDLAGLPTFFLTVRTLGEQVASPSSSPGVTVLPLLQSSSDSQAATDFEGGEIRLSQSDRRGPLPFGYTVEGRVAAATTVTTTAASDTQARLVIIGDADFASNAYLSSPSIANGALFLNAVAWLAEQEELIALPPKPQFDRSMAPLTDRQSKFVFYSSAFGLPLLVLAVGIGVWWRRR
ncbi:MAG: GldG family protein [Chloroflexaceae bacterium]|nr:GldG family protein [Chloroflexaceae bacterium]